MTETSVSEGEIKGGYNELAIKEYFQWKKEWKLKPLSAYEKTNNPK